MGVQARVGVLTSADVNGPMPTPGGGGKMFDLSEGATWALIYFLVAIAILFVV